MKIRWRERSGDEQAERAQEHTWTLACDEPHVNNCLFRCQRHPFLLFKSQFEYQMKKKKSN